MRTTTLLEDFISTTELILYSLFIVSIVGFQGCFTASAVNEESCKNSSAFIACFHGEVVWNANLEVCRCVCDDGRWGSRCQYPANWCGGKVVVGQNGQAKCSCEELDNCESKLIFLLRDKYCSCTPAGLAIRDDDDEPWFGYDDKSRTSPMKSDTASTDYFPFGRGQAWLYDIMDSTGVEIDQWAISLRDTFTINDTIFQDVQLVLSDSLGELDVMPGPLFFNLPSDTNQIWIYYSASQTTLFTFHQFPEPGNLSIDGDMVRIDSVGQVTVPAGTFDNCMTITDTEENSSFIYAPGVGLVKTTANGQDNMVLSAFRNACTLTASAALESISCDSTTGTISISTSGGQGELAYDWTGPTDIGNIPNPVNLQEGIYSATVTDEVCRVVFPEISIERDSSTQLGINGAVQSISCFGDSTGAIDISVSGGSGIYNYSWNDGLYTTEDISNLGSGEYHVVVSDTAGCSSEETFTISEVTLLTVSKIGSMDVACQGASTGMLEVAVSGGIPPYSVDWNDGLYQGLRIEGLAPGKYYVLVTDGNDCMVMDTFELGTRSSKLPMNFSVQGVLSDSSGSVLEDGTYDLYFSLYMDPVADSVIWEEDHFDVAVQSGIFNAVLGSFEVLDLCFDMPYFLGISIDYEEEMRPRIPLTSVPYSLMAKNVDDQAITTNKIKDMAVTPEKISVDVLSGINGIRNDAGEISIEAGDNIVVTSDLVNHSITISALSISQDSSVTTDEILPDVVSSINQVTNDGGNIDIVAGDNVSIVANDSVNTITISAKGGNESSEPDSITLDQIIPDLVSSISGVINDGGEITILAGDNVIVTPDDVNNTITITASDSGTGVSIDQLWQERDGGIFYDGDHVHFLRSNGSRAVQMAKLSDGAGYLATHGPNGFVNVQMTDISDSPDNGFLSLHNIDGLTRAAIYSGTSGSGSVYTNGANGKTNTLLGFLANNPDNGFVGVFDAAGNSQSGIYVDADGFGRVFADSYDSFVDHPSKSSIQIQKTSLQGVEAGIYLRGTASLVDGKTNVVFPEYFQSLISDQNITVMITPLSAESKGIAVIKKKTTGFNVQELLKGKGNYNFDWEVKAIRKGFENYEVLKVKGSATGVPEKVETSNSKNN